jgi:hypothetical protein
MILLWLTMEARALYRDDALEVSGLSPVKAAHWALQPSLLHPLPGLTLCTVHHSESRRARGNWEPSRKGTPGGSGRR